MWVIWVIGIYIVPSLDGHQEDGKFFRPFVPVPSGLEEVLGSQEARPRVGVLLRDCHGLRGQSMKPFFWGRSNNAAAVIYCNFEGFPAKK